MSICIGFVCAPVMLSSVLLLTSLVVAPLVSAPLSLLGCCSALLVLQPCFPFAVFSAFYYRMIFFKLKKRQNKTLIEKRDWDDQLTHLLVNSPSPRVTTTTRTGPCLLRSHRGGRDPSTWAIIRCFPGCMFPGEWRWAESSAMSWTRYAMWMFSCLDDPAPCSPSGLVF